MIYTIFRDLFVAGFIGNVRMNMVPARLRNSRLIGDGFEVGCPAHVRSCEFKPLEVLLGVRPESLDIVGSPGEWTIPAKVQSVMPMGSVALTQVSIGDNGTNIVVQHERSYNFGRGDNVYVKFDPDALHVFDAQSELALGR